MISFIKIYLKDYIIKIKDIIVNKLFEELDIENKILKKLEEQIIQQNNHITYLSQRVHTLNKPIIENQSRNFHFPTIDELIFEYRLFVSDIHIKPSQQTIRLEIDGNGIETNYRYVDQANHRLFLKIVSSDGESVWYDCCDTIRPIGIIEKDGSYCIKHDKKYKSSSYERICYIPSSKINGDCKVFLRFGKQKELNIQCNNIKVSTGPL